MKGSPHDALVTALDRFPLLSHAAVERLVTLGGDVTGSFMPFTRRHGGAGQHQQLAPAAQKLPDVGYLRQLNAEGILALRPQLVLASAGRSPRWSYTRYRRAG